MAPSMRFPGISSAVGNQKHDEEEQEDEDQLKKSKVREKGTGEMKYVT